MSRYARTVSIFFTAIIVLTISTAPSVMASPCSSSKNVEACSGTDSVTVSGGASSQTGETHGNGLGPSASGDPTTASVNCTNATSGKLNAIGDTNPTADVHACAALVPECTQKNPQNTGGALTLVQQPDGTYVYGSQNCIAPTQPQVTAALVRARVVRLIPTASLGLAPTDSTLVNIQTITWVNAPRQQTLPAITLLGRQISISLTLARVSWDFGDGRTATTTSPGTPYDAVHHPCRTVRCPGYYGHTYREPGTDTLHATAAWTATFTVDGGAAIPIPGTIDGPTATTTLTVKEARSVLVPDGH